VNRHARPRDNSHDLAAQLHFNASWRTATRDETSQRPSTVFLFTSPLCPSLVTIKRRGWQPLQGLDLIQIEHQFKGLGLDTLSRSACNPYVGGFGIRPFIQWIERSLQLVRLNSKGSNAMPQEIISPSLFSRVYLSARTLCRQHNGQVSAGIQSVGVSIGLFGFIWDETPRANPTYPICCSQGFARWASSSLTINVFEFGCDLCFRDAPDEREFSKGFVVFSRRAPAMMAKRHRKLWRDITGRRLREDLIGDFPKIA
jgi:hypothetical protein